jgi:sulfur-carrier protein
LQIQIRYFASVRDAIGHSSELLQCDGGTVAEIRKLLVQRGGGYEESLRQGKVLRCAVDHVMVDESTVLRGGAELAFFPPVTGG